MKQRIKQIEREMRFHTLRSWAFGLAIASGVTAFFTAGSGHPLTNIETWSSSYAVMAGTGLLKSSLIPLIIITVIFLIIGFILHLVIKRMENSK